MTYTLIKLSSPGWEKDFISKDEMIDELRDHICSSCLVGPSMYVGENGELVPIDEFDPIIDVEYKGEWFYCRDIGMLLSTACGCEFTVEIDGKAYYEV